MKRVKKHNFANLRKKIVSLKILFFIVFLIQLFSCNKYPFDKGVTVIKTVNCDTFSSVKIFNETDVYLFKSDTNYVQIRADANIIDNIICNTENGILSVSDNNKSEWIRGYDQIDIYIGIDTLSTLSVLSSANIYCKDTLVADYCYVEVSKSMVDLNLLLNCYLLKFQAWNSTGIYSFEGRTTYSYITNFGNGIVEAANLVSNYAYVQNFSTGDCNVNVKEMINYQIFSSGSIICQGNPKENSGELFSKGEFIKP